VEACSSKNQQKLNEQETSQVKDKDQEKGTIVLSPKKSILLIKCYGGSINLFFICFLYVIENYRCK
jgi:hypothetical protein